MTGFHSNRTQLIPTGISPRAGFALKVNVDGAPCPTESFLPGPASEHPELGCRIQVISDRDITESHRRAARPSYYGSGLFVNFHGQVVSLNYCPVTQRGLAFLVDLTGQPTGIRLMLPARTCLVENEAYHQLKAVLELETYKYLQALGQHGLSYNEYLRAKELGIELPEATPDYHVGLLRTDIGPEPIAVEMPPERKLSDCYRLAEALEEDESAEANVHLLAALGEFDKPFVPITIDSSYDGYSWAKLPTVEKVEMKKGRTLQESRVDVGVLICVDKLRIEAYCSDGKVFRSDACGRNQPIFTATEICFNGHVDSGKLTSIQRARGLIWPDGSARGLAIIGRDDAAKGSWGAGPQVLARVLGPSGDGSYETFHVQRIRTPIYAGEEMTDGRWNDFCKTNYRPYDLCVQCCLIVLNHRLGSEIFGVSSDGDSAQWNDARDACQHVLGYGMDWGEEKLAIAAAPPTPPAAQAS